MERVNIIEAYNKALSERQSAGRLRTFNLGCIVLLLALYAVMVPVKGWEDRYLVGLVGVAMLGFNAGMRHREWRFWDREIKDFNQALKDYTKT